MLNCKQFSIRYAVFVSCWYTFDVWCSKSAFIHFGNWAWLTAYQIILVFYGSDGKIDSCFQMTGILLYCSMANGNFEFAHELCSRRNRWTWSVVPYWFQVILSYLLTWVTVDPRFIWIPVPAYHVPCFSLAEGALFPYGMLNMLNLRVVL